MRQIESLVLIILLGKIIVYPKSLIEQISWKGADSSTIISMSIVITFISAILMFFYYRNRTLGKKEKKELSGALFKEYVDKAELNSVEIEKLNTLIGRMNITDKHLIFQSISLFEQCIEKEVQSILRLSPLSTVINDEDIVLSSIRKKLGYNFLPLEHQLVSSRNIEVGQKVSIYKNNDKHSAQGTHAVVVMNQQFVLRLQIKNESDEKVMHNHGDIITITFARQGDGIYGIDMKILSFDGYFILELQHTLSMKRNQLRQFVRIEVNFPIKIRIVQTVNEDDKILIGKQFEAKLIDISGGGLSFILDRPLVPGEIISMNFLLSRVAFSGHTGRVLRVSLVETNTSTTYRHHVSFIDIGQSMREKIVKYVFEKQRQLNQWR